LPDAFGAEFTGERVIPGRVEDNLFNEHLARYRFSAGLWREVGQGVGRMLDAGCGAGYGTAELAKSGAEVLGIDVSEEAIAHARAHYGASANIRFEQASCMAIPAETQAFRLIAAFEVIEHLEDWRGFLREAYRVLDDAGIFLVSTPNRLYYAESRQKAGPNPFHVHEFTEEEFRSELAQVFPHVKIMLQNHVEGMAFSGAETEGASLEIGERNADPKAAHFFLAVCGKQPLSRIASYVFIPESGNVLQTRERHIALLDQWIEREQVERRKMLDKVREMEGELEEHNQWAQRSNVEAERRAQLVAALQEELQKSNDWAQVRDAEAVERGRRVEQLQVEVAQAVAWAKEREIEAEERGQRVERLQVEVEQAVAWAKDREAEAEQRGKRVVELQTELTLATAWATSRDVEAEERGERIVQLQDEIEQWRRQKEAADQWAMETERRLSAERDEAREAFVARGVELENVQERMAALQAEAEQLRAQLAEANSQMDMIAQSRWVKLGRVVKIGPEIRRN
jgi:SAM-dependent methyltransferase